MSGQTPESIVLRMIMDVLKARAEHQDKTLRFESIFKMMFGPMMERIGAASDPPANVDPTLPRPGELFRIHAGMMALMRLTDSDDLIKWLRPIMVEYAKDPDFRLVAAAAAKQNGIIYSDVTAERYGWVIDGVADRILKQARAA